MHFIGVLDIMFQGQHVYFQHMQLVGVILANLKAYLTQVPCLKL